MSAEESPPKKRRMRGYVLTEARKAQQAKYLKSGNHGQPRHGRPKQHVELVRTIRDNGDEILGTMFSLMRKARLSPGDKTRFMVCADLLDRGFGKAAHVLAAMIQHYTGLDGTTLNIEGASMSPLLAEAHKHVAREATKKIQPPSAAKAITISDADVITVNPEGEATVVQPQEEPEEPEPVPSSVVNETAAPASSSATEDQPKEKYSGYPADAAAHFMRRDAARESSRQNDEWLKQKQDEARAQGRPGGQVPMNEFSPDPPERAMQGSLDVIQFTRISGGRGIKRCLKKDVNQIENRNLHQDRGEAPAESCELAGRASAPQRIGRSDR